MMQKQTGKILQWSVHNSTPGRAVNLPGHIECIYQFHHAGDFQSFPSIKARSQSARKWVPRPCLNWHIPKTSENLACYFYPRWVSIRLSLIHISEPTRQAE